MGKRPPPLGLGGQVQLGWSYRKGDRVFAIEDGCLVLWCVRTHRFTPDQVVSIERVGPAWLGAGVRIVHNRPELPARIRFICRGGSARVFELLARTGFAPSGSGPAGVSRWTSGLRAVLVMGVVNVVVIAACRLYFTVWG